MQLAPRPSDGSPRAKGHRSRREVRGLTGRASMNGLTRLPGVHDGPTGSGHACAGRPSTIQCLDWSSSTQSGGNTRHGYMSTPEPGLAGFGECRPPHVVEAKRRLPAGLPAEGGSLGNNASQSILHPNLAPCVTGHTDAAMEEVCKSVGGTLHTSDRHGDTARTVPNWRANSHRVLHGAAGSTVLFAC